MKPLFQTFFCPSDCDRKPAAKVDDAWEHIQDTIRKLQDIACRPRIYVAYDPANPGTVIQGTFSIPNDTGDDDAPF